jgi:hypothetical protein
MIWPWIVSAIPALRGLAAGAWAGLRSPWLLVLLGALAFAGWTAWIWSKAHGETVQAVAAARSECQAAALEAQIAEMKLQLDAANASARTAMNALTERAELADRLRKERDDYAAALTLRPPPPGCGFDADDVRSLLRIGPVARSPKAGAARREVRPR